MRTQESMITVADENGDYSLNLDDMENEYAIDDLIIAKTYYYASVYLEVHNELTWINGSIAGEEVTPIPSITTYEDTIRKKIVLTSGAWSDIIDDINDGTITDTVYFDDEMIHSIASINANGIRDVIEIDEDELYKTIGAEWNRIDSSEIESGSIEIDPVTSSTDLYVGEMYIEFDSTAEQWVDATVDMENSPLTARDLGSGVNIFCTFDAQGSIYNPHPPEGPDWEWYIEFTIKHDGIEKNKFYNSDIIEPGEVGYINVDPPMGYIYHHQQGVNEFSVYLNDWGFITVIGGGSMGDDDASGMIETVIITQ